MEINRFRLGQVVNAVGLKGEVKVYPYTDYKERFEELEWVYMEDQKVYIEKVRYQGRTAIIKFRQVEGREDAEGCKGKTLYIDRQNARKLPENTYFIADLIGLEVVDQTGKRLGRVVDVIQHSAQDLYEIEKEPTGGEAGSKTKKQETFLVPAVEEFIKSVDLQQKKITVDLIDGFI